MCFFYLTGFLIYAPAGDVALEQLREEKEFAEGQVRPSVKTDGRLFRATGR